MTTSSQPLRGALLSLASFCVYACCDVTVKALGSGQNSFAVMFLAAGCSVPFILAQIFLTDRHASLRPRLLGMAVGRVVITILGGSFVTYSFTQLPLAQCYAIFFTMPLLITLLAWPILGEPIDPLRGLIVLVGFAGVVIALQPGSTPFQLAHLTAACGAVTGAINSLMLRKIGHRESPGVVLLYPTLFQFLAAACVLPFVWQPFTATEIQLGLLIGILSTCGGLLIISAYRIAPTIAVAPMQYSQIIWASALGYLFWREAPSAISALGIGVIVAAGMALLVLAGRSRPEGLAV